MTVYYLDSSAWIKRYVTETGSRSVSNLFSGNPALGCSVLGLLEVTATLARKRKAGDLRAEDMVVLERQIENDWRAFYQIPLLESVVDAALSLARTEALRGADALHLASALLLLDNLKATRDELIFVGSDRELNVVAKRLGLSVIDPRDAK